MLARPFGLPAMGLGPPAGRGSGEAAQKGPPTKGLDPFGPALQGRPVSC